MRLIFLWGKGGLWMKGKWKAAIVVGLPVLAFVCGVAMLIFGITGEVQLRQATAGYDSTQGYFSDYDIYSAKTGRHGSSTYRLIYSYTVDGQEYTVSTDYGSGSIPNQGSPREVWYDPQNPEEAVLSGGNSHQLLIFMGAMFTAVPLVFLLGALTVLGVLRWNRVDVVGLVIGVVFAGLGAGFLYFMIGSVPIQEFVQSMVAPFALIPLLMVIAGVWLVIRSLFFSGKESRKRGARKKS